MAESLQPTTQTDVDPTALYLALLLAWQAQVGTTPTRASLLVLMAQSDLETGTWKACKNFNLAGIKHVPGDGHDYAKYLTRELLNGQWVTLTQEFRAYASLDEAVADYMRVLRGRFGYAWPAVEAGDTADFAHRLRQRGYYTAPEQTYAAGLEARYKALDARIAPDTLPEIPPLAPDNAPSLDLEAEEVGGEGPGPGPDEA